MSCTQVVGSTRPPNIQITSQSTGATPGRRLRVGDWGTLGISADDEPVRYASILDTWRRVSPRSGIDAARLRRIGVGGGRSRQHLVQMQRHFVSFSAWIPYLRPRVWEASL